MIIHTGLVTPFVSFTKMEYKEMQTVGKRLAEIRKSNKIKQIELAEMLNVSQQVISNIERGVTTPDIEQLKKIADIYNISLDQLVGREFFGDGTDGVEQKIISYIKQMDDEGKELSLGLFSIEETMMATNSYFNENSIEELLDEIKYVYQSDRRPWVIGYSGGKDSTTVVELVYKMLLTLPKKERNKNVYIVSSDTLIENPLIKIYLSKMNKLIGTAADNDDLPIISAMVTPSADNSFWANVIGRGFPTPRMNGTFRWCTDRLKINPSADYIRDVIKKEGEEVVVLLGVRKAESEARRRRIEGRELAKHLMNRHETIQDAYVYNPIVELTTDDVWDVLLKLDGGKTPWGSNNNELVSLYADADSGECPFAGIHAGGQTQSCGNSRFGCWVCTVVKDDKSLNGFIKSGHRELIPLAEFRTWIMSIRDKDEYREKKRRNGTVYETKNGEMGYGPFTWEARKLILTKLIETQQKMGYKLITQEELKAIDEIWDDELDLSRRTLVELYEELTGEKLPWYQYKEPLIDEETIEELERLAAVNDVPFDLVRNIILSVYHNKNYSNQRIMKDALERLLNQQWLHHEILKEIEDENK